MKSKNSPLETFFDSICRGAKIKLEREYRFHPTRKWRFDFVVADLSKKIAIECEGGAYSKGRHTRGSGFVGDCEKYNAAVILGWRVLRYPTKESMADFPQAYRELTK